MGFHKAVITRGVYGEVSKIYEEWLEAEDALAQGQYLMLLIELSDMVGAAAGVAYRYGVTLEGLRLLMGPLGDEVLLPHLSLRDHLQEVFVQIHLLDMAVADNQDGNQVTSLLVGLCRLIHGLIPKVAPGVMGPEFLTQFAELRSRVAREEEGTP